MPTKATFLKLFYLAYTCIGIVWAVGMYQILLGTRYSYMVPELGNTFGQMGVVAFVVTLSPGIMMRFQLRSKWQGILMVLRRHLGILTYLLVCTHLSFVRLGYLLRGLIGLNAMVEWFELSGIIAFFLLTPLFLTSNDYSLSRLKGRWFTLHKLAYVILGCVFFHVALQEPGDPFALLLGVTVILEFGSYGYKRYKSRKILTSSQQNQSSDKSLG